MADCRTFQGERTMGNEEEKRIQAIETSQFILQQAASLAAEEDINRVLPDMLSAVGARLGAERAYVIGEKNGFLADCEWCAAEIPPESTGKDPAGKHALEVPVMMGDRKAGVFGVAASGVEVRGLVADSLTSFGQMLGARLQTSGICERKDKRKEEVRRAHERSWEALTSRCEYCYTVDVTEGLIHEDFTTAHGINLVKRMGLALPVSFDELNERYQSEFQIEFLKGENSIYTKCQGILDAYARGEKILESEYYSPKTDIYTRVSALLSEDEQTGHVHAVIIATDTSRSRKEEARLFRELLEARQQLKSANQETNLRLETVLNGVAGGFMISRDDKAYTFEYVSEGVAKIQGYTSDELRNVSGNSSVGNCYPPDLDRTLELLSRQYAKGDTFSVKYRVRHRDGSLKWVMENGRKMKDTDGVCRHYSLVQDVTELEERNIALKDANDIQKQILSAISCGVFAYTLPEHDTIVINDVAKDIMECGSDKVSDFIDFYRTKIIPGDREMVVNMFNTLKEPGDSARYKYRIRRSDGSIGVLENNTKLLQFSNGQQYILCSLLDITAQSNLEMLLSTERSQYREAMLLGAEFSFAIDLTEGSTQHSLKTKDGMISLEQLGFKPPVYYDDLLARWCEYKKIEPVAGSSDAVMHREKLLEIYECGDTRAEAEYYSSELDQYYDILTLLSRMEKDGHIRAIFIAYNKSEQKREEQRRKAQLLETREILSTVNEELRASLEFGKDKMAIIAAMSNIYYANYLINLKEDSIEAISGVPYLESYFPREHKVKEAFQLWIDNVLDESFREEMEKFMDLGTLSERMRDVQSINIECISKKAGWIRLSLISVARDPEGNVRQMLLAAQHIDVEKKKELAQQEALKAACDAANRANAAKTDFLASMSHDIRTPMNGIIGMTAIAGTHLDDRERVADCLNKITMSSKHLLGLINEVLDMSRIESGKMDLNNEEFSLPDLLDNLLTMVKPQVKAKNHDLSVFIRGIEHEKVVGDSQRIQQSFMNLMSNAVKYTPEGGKIVLSITEKPMNKKKVGCYEFVFEDNGIGMSEEFQKHLFDPFTRATDSRVAKVQGTGLGMAITRNMVQMMNGDIKVESEPEKGTKITVTILLKLQNEEDVSYDELRNLPALVVDDDSIACESACEVLEELGMKGEWVLSGQEAVDRIVSRHEEKEDFFIVIIDWKMPGMDGIATTKEIRRRVGDKMPIVIITAYDWSDIEQEARAAGANAILSKPLFKSRMVPVFNDLLGYEQAEEGDNSLGTIIKKDFLGKRVLLVEDNELNAEIAGEILGMAGLTVDYAENGKEALDIMSSVPDDYYDIVFMDIQMPVMNGYDATAAIRTLSRNYTKRVPIIAMTANAFREDIDAARSAGMNQHMAKPLDFNQLMETLNRWLK